MHTKLHQRILIEEQNARLQALIADYHSNYNEAPLFLIDHSAPKLSADVLNHCVVLPSREDIIARMSPGGIAIEVGTQTGSFARKILDLARPKKLYVVDVSYNLFNREILENEIETGQLEMRQGLSWDVLSSFDDEYFDWIYIDAGHYYSQVARDIDEAFKKLKPGGYLIFNDFTVWSPLEAVRYGIYKAVCEAIDRYGMPMVYLGLHPTGFQDVALLKTAGAGLKEKSKLARDIIVHSMGKVGNRRITAALHGCVELSGREIIYTHVVGADQIESSREFYHSRKLDEPEHLLNGARIAGNMKTPGWYGDFVIPIRNPVYRNIADFIENISIYASKAEQSNASRLVDIFNQRYPVEACDTLSA
jgi:SAM-dependent methyltransferase